MRFMKGSISIERIKTAPSIYSGVYKGSQPSCIFIVPIDK